MSTHLFRVLPALGALFATLMVLALIGIQAWFFGLDCVVKYAALTLGLLLLAPPVCVYGVCRRLDTRVGKCGRCGSKTLR